MKLLCKLVTNPLKPTACAHPISLCNSLSSELSDLHYCVGCGRGPWLESVINFPFLPVALSWRPSLFPLRDSDIGHNTHVEVPAVREREQGTGLCVQGMEESEDHLACQKCPRHPASSSHLLKRASCPFGRPACALPGPLLGSNTP